MNARERFIETLTFGNPDKIPFMPGYGRESTLKRWHEEGLPAQIESPESANRHAYEIIGGTLKLPIPDSNFYLKTQMIPEFEKKILEKKQNSQIVQDWKGNICEISNEYTVDHLGGNHSRSDFVTRRWIKCPVEIRQDWADMQTRYDASDPSRLPKNLKEIGKQLKERDYPLEIHFSGPYWQLREWMGFEQLSVAFYDDPCLVQDMIEFWRRYISTLLKQVFNHVIPDSIYMSEDMAYKGFSMLSPSMCKEFLKPCWLDWGHIIRDAGVPIYAVDSDGFVGELIPIWIDCGINVCDPMEVAAGNNIVEFRKKFSKKMAYRGGIDKRCIAEGGAVIEKEIARVSPVIREGGYIPGCDHGMPHDISWDNYLHYIKLLAQETGWL